MLFTMLLISTQGASKGGFHSAQQKEGEKVILHYESGKRD